MKKFVVLLICLCLLLGSCGNNSKDPHPYYDLISTFDIGSDYDNIAHAFAKALEQEFKKPVNIINTKNETQINSSNDGYTMVFSNDFTGKYFSLMPIANERYVIISNNETIYDNIEKLLTIINRNPNEILMAFLNNDMYSSAGKFLLNKYGYEPKIVNYENSEDCINAVINEDVEFAVLKFSVVETAIKENKVLLLSTFSNQPLDDYPDVPTISDIITGSEEDIIIPLNPITLSVNSSAPDYMKDYLRIAADNAIDNASFNRFMELHNYEKLYTTFHSYDEITEMFEKTNNTLSLINN